MKQIRSIRISTVISAALIWLSTTVAAQDANPELERLTDEIARQRAEIDRQAEELERRSAELDALQQRLEAALSQAESGDSIAPEQHGSKVFQTDRGFVSDEPTLILTGADLVADDFPGSFPIFGTDARMRVGGYVKADAIFDFDGHGDPDQFLLGQIAVDGSPEAARDGYFNAHARETRFNLDFRETTPGEPAKQAFVEVDFFTPPDSSAVLRLRHAYAVYGDFIVGRSWTTVSELRALPFMIDFAFGDSLYGGRTEQVRWQQPLGGGSLALALENPSDNSIANPLGLEGRASPRFPYFAARWSNDDPARLFTVGTQIQQLRWDGEDAVPDETAMGWALVLAGRWQLNDMSYLTGTASYSDGFSEGVLALAGGGGSAVITPQGLETDRAVTFSVGGAVNWTDTWSSNFHLAWLDRSGDALRPGSETESGGIGHVNLMWKPSNKVRTGVEYIWGTRDTLDGSSGDGARLMGMFRYDFGVPY
jgi:hypothetical protein